MMRRSARRMQWSGLVVLMALLATGAYLLGGALPGSSDAGIATANAPPPARSAAPTAVGVPWIADDGTAFAVMVDGADLEAFQRRRAARLAAEAERIEAEARALARAGANAAFVPLIERVPLFTDWVYGWVESYFAAYLIAERAIERMILGDEQGRSVGVGAAIEGAFRGVVSERFEQIVIRPVAPRERLQENWRRVSDSLVAEWRDLVARDRELWDEFLFARSQAGLPFAARSPDLTVCALAPDLGDLRVDDERLQHRLDPEQTDLFALRFARPYAARVTVVGLRLAGVGPAFGASGAIGAGLGTVGSFALISTVATATIWSLDYLINRIDEALYRPEFEARLVGALVEAERQEAEDAGARAARALGAAVADLAKCGAPPLYAGSGPMR